jgi:hypothetical protein
MFGTDRGLVRSERFRVKPEPGNTTVVRSNVEARPHIDDNDFMPANVQILCCVRPSRQGGDSIYIDSWSMLARIEEENRPLFRALFEVPRVFKYVDMTPVRPTFSVRYGNLIFSHSPAPDEHDAIARLVTEWVDRSPRYQFLAEAGDICVINNQRLLHGRQTFQGQRELVRLLYWFSKGFPSHPKYLARARRFARRVARHNTGGPTWVREWLQPSERSAKGLFRVAAIMEYIAADDESQLARRLGVSAFELERWTARMICVAASTLGEPDAELLGSRAVIQHQVHSVIDGLVGENRPRNTRRRRRDR